MSTHIYRVCLIVGTLACVNTNSQETFRSDDHAPIGVMADHYHEAGELMFSYRYMSMFMQGSSKNGHALSSDVIATTIPNRFFGMTSQPPTLRIVPTKMTMGMHMLGAMFAPTDSITLMAMINYVDNEMRHLTYQGMMGTTVLDTFTTTTSGMGDTSFKALIRIRETDTSRLHITAGFSLPTGDLNKTAIILNPMGMKPAVRAPYPMQLGSGTSDVIGGLTYSRFHDRWSWGAQWQSIIRTGTNDEGYTLGDEHRLTGWYSRSLTSHFSWSARAEHFDRNNIQGIDSKIMGPTQTANPEHHAAKKTSLGIGLNFATESGHRIGLEYVMPFYQHLDGPQLEVENQLILGYQLVF